MSKPTEPRCPTPCDSDCDAVCHATHDPSHKQSHHWPEDCPAAEQYDWGTSYANAAVKRLRDRVVAAEAHAARMVQQHAAVIEAWRTGNSRRDRLDSLTDRHRQALLDEAMEQRTRAEQADANRDAATAELAELRSWRASLGEREIQWATRTTSFGRVYPDVEWLCRRRAALRYGEPQELVQRDVYPTEWRVVDSRKNGDHDA